MGKDSDDWPVEYHDSRTNTLIYILALCCVEAHDDRDLREEFTGTSQDENKELQGRERPILFSPGHLEIFALPNAVENYHEGCEEDIEQ